MRKNLKLVATLIGLVGLSACVNRPEGASTFPVSLNVFTSDAQIFDALVKAGGYDYVNPSITYENFPVKFSGTGETILQLVSFYEWFSSEEALDRLDKMDFRPARIEELLVFGTKYPDEQRKYPIVALGSSCVVDGSRRVLVLYRHSTDRYLDLLWFDSRWDSNSRFLVVRK